MQCRRGLAMRILPVRLSVRPSVKRVIYDKMEQQTVQIFIPYERSFKKKNGWWGWPLLREFFLSNGPLWSEIADFQPIFACNSSAVTPNEKRSINTNTRFTMSLKDDHRTLPVSPPKGVSKKRKTADLSLKWHFAWRKSATKFLCGKLSAAKL